MTNLQGEPIGRDAWQGKLVLLDFWATWCKPCEKGMPKLSALYERHQNDLVVFGVSIDEGDDARDKVAGYAKKKKLAYPIGVDLGDDPAWAAFKVCVVPSLYLLDGSNQVIRQWIGKVDYDAVASEIASILGERGQSQ